MHLLQGFVWRDPPQLLKLERALEESLLLTDDILDDLKGHLLKAQHWMKQQEDLHRRDLEFQVGDQVYMRSQPYRQTSLANRLNDKPYLLLGSMDFLKSLEGWVKCLTGYNYPQQPKFIRFFMSANFATFPSSTSSNSWFRDGYRTIRSIKWKGLRDFDATWEDYKSILTFIPSIHLETRSQPGWG